MDIFHDALLWLSGSWDALGARILNYDILLQATVLGAAGAAAFVVFRVLDGRMQEGIAAMPVSPVFKKMLHNFRRQFFALFLLALLFFVQLAAAAGLAAMPTGMLAGASSLLLAWVVIRLAVQFVKNRFLRNMFAVTIWLMAALSLLGVLTDTMVALDSLGMDVGKFRLSALSIVKAGLAIFFMLYIAGVVSSLLERRIQGIGSLTPSTRVLLVKIVKVVLVTFALLIGVTAAGIDLSLLAVFSGALGLGIGFGLQKGVSNLFSGMMLLMDKSISPGDVIELPNGAFGWVHHMGARYTEIITRDNKSYLVPNEDFITQQVVNWSHGDTLIRIETKFGVSYDCDPHKVKALAEEAALKPDRVVAEPAPVCHLVEFGDSSLNFVLRFWIRDAEKGVTNMRGAVMLALWDAFRANGIAIPYPHREIIMRTAEA